MSHNNPLGNLFGQAVTKCLESGLSLKLIVLHNGSAQNLGLKRSFDGGNERFDE